jgi:hypothetical protein
MRSGDLSPGTFVKLRFRQVGIEVGSGSVESKVKQIGSRVKLVGAQWKAENVPKILHLRCAYLNGDITLGISA